MLRYAFAGLCSLDTLMNMVKDWKYQDRKQTKKLIRKLFVSMSEHCLHAHPPRVMVNDLNRYFMTPPLLQSSAMKQHASQEKAKIEQE